jgi:hypothetical protein
LKIWNFSTGDLYAPIGEEHDERFFKRDAHWGMDAIALLKPGVSLDQAREDMARVNAGLAATYPDVNTGLKSAWGARERPLEQRRTSGGRTPKSN